MGTSFLLVGSIIVVVGTALFIGIRYKLVSVIQATIVMVVVSGISGAIMELSIDGNNQIGATFTGFLLAAIFGFWTFVFGRMLEQWVSKQSK
jgi:hypothetical protein